MQVLTVYQLRYGHKEKILKKARTKGHLTYKGSPVIILRDMESEVGKLHAQFNKVKTKLQSFGFPYRLFYIPRNRSL